MFYADRENNWARERIRERADAKYGGVTTVHKAVREIKLISQKFAVGDLVTVQPLPGKDGVKIGLSAKLQQRLSIEGRYSKYLAELMDAINDCGYDVAVGENFLEVHKA